MRKLTRGIGTAVDLFVSLSRWSLAAMCLVWLRSWWLDVEFSESGLNRDVP